MAKVDQNQSTVRIVSPEVAMAILVYEYGFSSSDALVVVSMALEKERRNYE